MSVEERLSVQHFLSVKEADINLANVTAIIGPQASGKSILAKLFYFGRSHISDYMDEILHDDFSIRSFKVKAVSNFLALFDGLDGFDRPFRVEYTYGDYSVVVERDKSKHKPRLKHSKDLDRDASMIKRAYLKFCEAVVKETPKRRGVRNKYFFVMEVDAAKEFYAKIPTCLFVPASRSFYSTVSDELFTFLASEERIDPLTAQFGSFYEFAKRRISGDWYGANLTVAERAVINKKIRPVLDGEYQRENSKDYIKTTWGRVPLRVSSSGQQEALPLLFTLCEYPDSPFGGSDSPKMLIIEEPEAHLFPAAQKYILDYIVEQAEEGGCKMLFTTHSPYVLACMNNHIVRKAKKSVDGSSLTFTAYFTGEGEAKAIVDDDGIIDTSDLDEISSVIAEEFYEAIKSEA